MFGFDEHLEAVHGIQGDARRCPRHPEVRTSSWDGLHDGLCHRCEAEADEDAQLADNEAFEAELLAQERIEQEEADAFTAQDLAEAEEAEAFHWLDEQEGGAL